MDQDWFDFLDLVSEAKANEDDREKLVDEVYRASYSSKHIYQCPKCGQLYIEDGHSGELVFMKRIKRLFAQMILKCIKM